MSCVLTAGQGQALGRRASRGARLPLAAGSSVNGSAFIASAHFTLQLAVEWHIRVDRYAVSWARACAGGLAR